LALQVRLKQNQNDEKVHVLHDFWVFKDLAAHLKNTTAHLKNATAHLKNTTAHRFRDTSLPKGK